MIAGWRRKAGAALLFAGLAVALGHVLSLPEAVPAKSEQPWIARAGETMRLDGVQGHVLAVEAATGGSASLRAERAALDADTVASLGELDIAAPEGPAPLHWLAGEAPSTRAIVRIEVAGGGPATLRLTPPADELDPELVLRADRGSLQVTAVVPVGDAPGGGTELRVGGALIMRSSFGATPIGFVVPEGGTLSLDTSAAPGAGTGAVRHRLGGSAGAELPLSSLAIHRRDGSIRHFACGAEAGAIAWAERSPARMACATGIAARDLRIGEEVQLRLEGNAFQAMDGVLTRSSWYDRIAANPLIAALLLLIYGALARWTYGVLFGGEGDDEQKPRQRRRRRAKRTAEER